MIEGLEGLLANGADTPELRFGLAKAYLERGDTGQAVAHLRVCVVQKPDYSAAWKLLGKALLQQGDADAAEAAWAQGLTVAASRGDKQAEKEMQVFLKRLRSQR